MNYLSPTDLVPGTILKTEFPHTVVEFPSATTKTLYSKTDTVTVISYHNSKCEVDSMLKRLTSGDEYLLWKGSLNSPGVDGCVLLYNNTQNYMFFILTPIDILVKV